MTLYAAFCVCMYDTCALYSIVYMYMHDVMMQPYICSLQWWKHEDVCSITN